MLIFFSEKMWVAFAVQKLLTFFSAKIIRILYLESAKTVNEMTLNELVKLTMLWTTGPWILDHRLLFLALPRRTLRYPISPALLDEKVKKLTTYWINTSQVIRQLNNILKTWLYCWISRNNAQLLTLVIPKGDKVNEMVYPIFWRKLQRKKIFRYDCFRYEKKWSELCDLYAHVQFIFLLCWKFQIIILKTLDVAETRTLLCYVYKAMFLSKSRAYNLAMIIRSVLWP